MSKLIIDITNVARHEIDELKEQLKNEHWDWKGVRERGSSAECWNKNFSDLKTFEKKHKHTNVLLKHDKQLYIWVLRMRQDFRKGKLSQDKIDKLNDIRFLWSLDFTNIFPDNIADREKTKFILRSLVNAIVSYSMANEFKRSEIIDEIKDIDPHKSN
tara:strand:+ start:108 stop:581 length:474 start_codon:yes stop_codon:yes gene_type:complete